MGQYTKLISWYLQWNFNQRWRPNMKTFILKKSPKSLRNESGRVSCQFWCRLVRKIIKLYWYCEMGYCNGTVMLGWGILIATYRKFQRSKSGHQFYIKNEPMKVYQRKRKSKILIINKMNQIDKMASQPNCFPTATKNVIINLWPIMKVMRMINFPKLL